MKRFIEEFKTFAMRGNVVDLAVGVIIGSAFTSIVDSLVEDIFTPLMGVLTGGIDFSSLSIGIDGAQIMVGNFINSVISFLIIAFSVFILVKALNSIAKKKEEAPKETKTKSDEVVLLEEIRDLLKKSKGKEKEGSPS